MNAFEATPPPSAAAAVPRSASSSAPTFSLFGVFRISSSHPVVLDGRDVPAIVQELEDVADSLAAENVAVHGWYDISGFRPDGDVLVWLRGTEVEDLQWALRQLRRCALLRPLIRSWSAVGLEPQAGDSAAGPSQPQSWLMCAASAAHHDAVLSAAPAGTTVHSQATLGQPGAAWVLLAESEEPAELLTLAPPAQESQLSAFIGRFVEPAELVEVLQ